MLGLITDRDQSNVDRRNELASKGWNNMTEEEQAEWSGDPLLVAGGVNLLPLGENYADGVEVKYRGDTITVTSVWDGSYIYAILAVGSAADYENKTMTLSLDSFYSSAGGTPQIALYWHDANGYEFAGAALTEAGSVTFTTTENTGARENLVIYLYATTDAAITAGDYIRYERIMLESGSTRHAYVPHYAVLPTNATKGAYNYSDLNRVEQACGEIGEEMGLSLTVKTNWTDWDIPKASDLNRILGNLRTLRGMVTVYPTTPAVPSTMSRMTYTTANQIEQILLDVSKVAGSTFRSGELYAGEV